MSRVARFALFVLGVLAASLVFGHPAPAQDTPTIIVIGTGSTGGVYYPAGQAICTAVKNRGDKHDLDCTAVSTKGSIENAEKVRSGAFTFGIVQSDVQYYAINGYGPFKAAGPDPDLRAVLAFHAESFTVVARADAGIRSFNDLKGKRVNIGNPGSGQRTSMDLVMNLKRWTQADFASVSELPADQQGQALCDNVIDAFVFTAGHPNESIKKTAEMCDVELVQTYDPTVQALIEKFPYFGPVRIPGNTYKGTGASTATFGVYATLVTSAKTPDAVVKQVIVSIFEDYIDFRFSHPALANVSPTSMVNTKQVAPYHPAAEAYFKLMGFEPQVDHVTKAPR